MNYKIWKDSTDSVPTVFIHSFVGNGEDVWKAAHAMGCKPFNLVAIFDFKGDEDLTPWMAENCWKGQPPFSGKAEEHLKKICKELIPAVEGQLPSPSSYLAMVGYSLAGLFTLWTAYRTATFKRMACVSASFWYPDFTQYMDSHEMMNTPEAIYFSLGDKESNTKHPLMKQVGEKTSYVFNRIQSLGIRSAYETNSGNHFKDSDQRTAKAILWLLEG